MTFWMLEWALLNEGLPIAGSAGELAKESDRSANASLHGGVGRLDLVCSFRIFMWRQGWSHTKPSPKFLSQHTWCSGLLSQYTWDSRAQDLSRGAQDYEDGLDIPHLVVEPAACCRGVWKMHLVVVRDPGHLRCFIQMPLLQQGSVVQYQLLSTVSCWSSYSDGCQAGHCWSCFLPSLVACQAASTVWATFLLLMLANPYNLSP